MQKKYIFYPSQNKSSYPLAVPTSTSISALLPVPDLQRVARTMRVVQKGFGLSKKLLCCISALPTQALKTEAKGDLLSEINNFQ